MDRDAAGRTGEHDTQRLVTAGDEARSLTAAVCRRLTERRNSPVAGQREPPTGIGVTPGSLGKVSLQRPREAEAVCPTLAGPGLKHHLHGAGPAGSPRMQIDPQAAEITGIRSRTGHDLAHEGVAVRR